MQRSNFSVEAMAADPNHSVAHMDIDRVLEKIPFRNIDEIGPAGSINSSPAMMAKYVQFHLDNGKVGEEQLLEETTSRTMQSPQMVMTGPLAARSADPELGAPSYGLGLMVSSYRGHPHVMHGGGIDGFISAMEWLPQDEIGVVVLVEHLRSGWSCADARRSQRLRPSPRSRADRLGRACGGAAQAGRRDGGQGQDGRGRRAA